MSFNGTSLDSVPESLMNASLLKLSTCSSYAVPRPLKNWNIMVISHGCGKSGICPSPLTFFLESFCILSNISVVFKTNGHKLLA